MSIIVRALKSFVNATEVFQVQVDFIDISYL